MKSMKPLIVIFNRHEQRTLLSSLRRPSLTVVAAIVLALAGLAADRAALAANGPGGNQGNGLHWVGTWTASPRIPTGAAATVAFNNQTLRQIVHTSVGGDRARVRLANTFGTVPLLVGAAHIALRDTGAAIEPGSDRALSFGGASSILIQAGAQVLSDPVNLNVPADGDLAISIYLPDAVGPSSSTNPITYHATARQTNYFSPQDGDHTGDVLMPVDLTSTSWWFLLAVDVETLKQTGAIVALGDSITDGTASTLDANRRWPNDLARRLLAESGNHKMAVLDAGIAGNRVLTGGTSGPNVQARLERDVLTQPGATYVIFLEGINDSSNTIFQADQIIAGHKQVIQRAHELGLTIYGATLTPAGSTGTRELNRQTVNAWIRTSGAYDAVIDWDVVTRDPNNLAFFLPIYDSGDHLHPNDVGYQAMADAVDLTLFKNGEGH